MNTLSFTVTIDGQESAVHEVEVTFDAARFSLRELVRLEDVLGTEVAERFFHDRVLPLSPKTLQAVIWAKLATQFPEVGLYDFDLPADAITAFGREDIEPEEVTIPMTTDEGTVNAAVTVGS